MLCIVRCSLLLMFLSHARRLCLQCLRRCKKGALNLIGLCCTSFCIPPLACMHALQLILQAEGEESIVSCLCLLAVAVMLLQTQERRYPPASILFPNGNRNYNFVRNGNRLASRCCLVMWYCLALGHVFLLEQPHGSMCEWHPRMELIFAVCCIFKCGIWGGLYALDRSEASPKRHVLYSNDEKLLHELTLAASHMTKEDMASFDGPALVKRQKREGGGESWTGVPGVLTKSQLGAYELLSPFSSMSCPS